ncbi:LuxR family transcriptional regulator [Streptomyces xinghaiensis]|uniref:LuxR family transcriptional regulator n=2 Tax=Streptomyces TaxID=1883 RepID=A0A3R7I2S9_9ACTN|nr:LuxR family transcriptional regulator [Streptomyces xinghaiensis]RKM92546.1 LuxR family transcriptional regulator [Streptomyces xinghaiensis]RNC70513.1 LuxR family transcriptional regulator [Streptomyces xinghaiensis]
MPVKIPTRAALTRLTPTETRVAERLVTGMSNAQGARELGMSLNTFTGHLASIGRKFQINSRTGRPARAHAVLASKQVAPPPAPTSVPDFTTAERRLLCALAVHPETPDIARAAGIAPADVRPQIADLVAKANADNETHLIGLGHAWRLLDADPTGSGCVPGATDKVG